MQLHPWVGYIITFIARSITQKPSVGYPLFIFTVGPVHTEADGRKPDRLHRDVCGDSIRCI